MATDRDALQAMVDAYDLSQCAGRENGYADWGAALLKARAALAAPPVEQQAGGFPVIADRGEVLGGGMPDWPAWCGTFRERKAYQQGVADARAMAQATAQPAPQALSAPDSERAARAKAMTAAQVAKLLRWEAVCAHRMNVWQLDRAAELLEAQPAPQAGAAEPALRPDIQAVLLELDVPVQGYLASHAGTFLKHAAMMPPEEYPIPLVRESDHRRACRKIAALATHPTEQPSQDSHAQAQVVAPADLSSILACEIECSVYEKHVVPVLERLGLAGVTVTLAPTCFADWLLAQPEPRAEALRQAGKWDLADAAFEAGRSAHIRGDA